MLKISAGQLWANRICRLLIGSMAAVVSLSSASTKLLAQDFELTRHPRPIRAIAVHPNSQVVYSASWPEEGQFNGEQLWNLATRTQINGELGRSRMKTNSAGYSANGECRILACEEGHVFRPSKEGNWLVRSQPPAAYCADQIADGQTCVIGGVFGLQVQSLVPGRGNVERFNWQHPSSEPVTGVAISAIGARIWAACGGTWDVDTPLPGKDHKLHVFEMPGQTALEAAGHHGPIWAVAATPDGLRAVSASEDRTLRIWDAKRLRNSRVLTGHQGPVYCVGLSSDGKRIVSGGADKMVRLWDADTGKELRRFAGHTDIVRAVALTADGKFALSGGNDRVLRVWAIDAPNSPPSAPGPPDARAPVPSSEAIAAATQLVRETFAQELKQAKKSAEKSSLADKLLVSSAQSQSDAESYALLREAGNLAVAGGDAVAAIRIVQELGRRFEIDALNEIAQLAKDFVDNPLGEAEARDLVAVLRALGEDAATHQQFDFAVKLMGLSAQAARKSGDSRNAKQIAGRQAELAESQRAAELFRQARARLAESPDDGDSHLAAGRYLCFVAGDWSEGLPHLTKGTDQPLRELAETELHVSGTPDEQQKLADRWWDLAQSAKGSDKTAFSNRSQHWYSAALPGLKGLVRTKAEKRIKSLTAADATADAGGGSSAGAVSGSAATSSLLGRVRRAIAKKALVDSEAPGRREDLQTDEFRELLPAGAMLIGFKYGIPRPAESLYMTAFQPIYMTAKGQAPGTLRGEKQIEWRTIVAKKGYAVAGVRSGGDVRDGFELIFARIGPKKLDLADTYLSEWIGKPQDERWARTIYFKTGEPIVGVFGATYTTRDGSNTSVQRLGLIGLTPE